jgi:4-hydroxy-tetrahydrodipicolinate reductase
MTSSPLRIVLVGHGRMGRLVESLAPELGCEIVGAISSASRARLDAAGVSLPAADVAIDFSTADAFRQNLPGLATRGLGVIVGTTGWQDFEPEARRIVEETGIGLVAAPNFSLGANLFEAIVARAAALFAAHDAYGAYLYEAHHAAKRDAPSGTARQLAGAMRRAGYDRPIDVSSTRAGQIPGTHAIGFDGPGESIVLTHTARDRTIFARGALQAARWLAGRRGWFTMKDVLGLN